jgi:hypothetical protein
MRLAAIATYYPQGSPILDLLVDTGWKPIRHVWEMAMSTTFNRSRTHGLRSDLGNSVS